MMIMIGQPEPYEGLELQQSSSYLQDVRNLAHHKT